MAAKFEIANGFAAQDVRLPERKTVESAGYDFYVAEDTLVPPVDAMGLYMCSYDGTNTIDVPRTLEEMAALTKAADAKITLIPTGVKCKLDSGTYLQLSVRSSLPLKHWLILGNGIGVIDADYYENPDNDGHIMFQLINLSPFPIILKKGDCIGQGVILPYLKTEDDCATGERIGGFGSTNV